jgi:hypothetical protein
MLHLAGDLAAANGIGEDKVLWRIAFEYDVPYIDYFRQRIKNIRKGFIPCLHPFNFFYFPIDSYIT